MYMIEKYSVKSIETFILGVIRQKLHVQFRVTLFDNFNDISTFTTTRYTM